MMIRRCYHVGRALQFPRAVSFQFKEPPTLQHVLVDSNDSLANKKKTDDQPPPTDVYVPASKQVFANISPPKNLVQISSSPESTDVSHAATASKVPGKNVVSTDLTTRVRELNALQHHQPPSTVPAPLFMEERLEHYRSHVPQRIMSMKFEQEAAEREFEEAQTLFELRTAVKLNLPIMDHVNFLDALTAFDRLVSINDDDEGRLRRSPRSDDDFVDRTSFTSEEIFNLPEFVVVVKGLVKYCRDFTADESLEVTTRLMELQLPVDSVPMLVFLELMKTHINHLTINQLVQLMKCLSRTAETTMRMLKMPEDNAEKSTSALSRLTATLMGTERLILLRFDEEQSWLSRAEIIDLITYVRDSQLTMELCRQAVTLLIYDASDLTLESISQYCRWMQTQNPESVIRNDNLEPLHSALFELLVERSLEDSGVNEEFYERNDRLSFSLDLLAAMLNVCSVQKCLRVANILKLTDTESSSPFCHASFDVARLVGLVRTNSLTLR